MDRSSSFYIVAKEPGAEHPALPTWANESANPIQLEEGRRASLERVEVEGVPGAYRLLGVLSRDECRRFIECTESLGYLPDAAVSLPRSVRHNHNATWVVDEETD
ncbi:MAG: oxidoreductase, partial [Deltaproteobacteria bacterium]|nr:oxidoreductase [Deltaproteobacteria bacterium]